MRNSITFLQLGSPSTLSLGAINALTSTRDLVLSGRVIIELLIIILSRTHHRYGQWEGFA